MRLFRSRRPHRRVKAARLGFDKAEPAFYAVKPAIHPRELLAQIV